VRCTAGCWRNGWLGYPGAEAGGWEIAGQNLADLLYGLRERQVVLILAEVGQAPVHLCGVCGFELQEPGQLYPRCALISEEDGAALSDARNLAERVEEWLTGGEDG
jgi:hypothetical protein